MDIRAKSLRRMEYSAVLLEDGNRPVEPGTMAIRILGPHDRITFTYSFL
jgi:hypothetical protein